MHFFRGGGGPFLGFLPFRFEISFGSNVLVSSTLWEFIHVRTYKYSHMHV